MVLASIAMHWLPGGVAINGRDVQKEARAAIATTWTDGFQRVSVVIATLKNEPITFYAPESTSC